MSTAFSTPNPAERRRSKRYPTQFEARLTTDRRETLLCRIEDYCDGGILFRTKGSAQAPIAVGDDVELTPPAADDEILTTITVRIVRLTDDGFGAMFRRPEPELLSLLKEYREAPDPQHPTKGKTDSDSAHAAIEQVGKSFARDHFQAVFSETLQQCAQEIHERLPLAATDQDYHEILKDLATIQTASEDVAQALVGPLLDYGPGTSNFGQPPAPANEDSSELSLIDVGVFEHWLEAAKVANTLEEKFGTQLSALKGLGNATEAARQPNGVKCLPFGPHHIVEALNEFSEERELGDIARAQLFAAAQGVLERSLGSFYERMQTRLKESSDTSRTADGAADTSSMRQSGPEETDAQLSLSPEPSQRKTDADNDQPIDPIPATTFTLDTGADSDLAAHGTGPDRRQPKQHAMLAAQALSTFAKDDGISKAANGWLTALQQSLLEQIIKEPAFLRQQQNPLRALIDELDHLGRLLQDSGQTNGEQRVVQAVSKIVTNAAADNGPSPQKFRNALAQIRQLTEQMSRRYQRNVERTVTNSVGRRRLKNARTLVVDELNRRYTGHLVPKVLPELLKTCWYAYLTLDALKNGEDTVGHNPPWDILDTLVQQLFGEPHRRLGQLPDVVELYAQLDKGLKDASFDPLRRERLSDELRELLIGVAATPDDLQIYIPVSATKPRVKPPTDEVPARRWKAAVQTVEQLKVGDLAQWQPPGQDQQQICLVWISDDKEDFTYVSQSGLRALETTRDELQQRVFVDEIRVLDLDQRSLTSRSVDGVLGNLEDQLKTKQTHDTLTGLLNRMGFQPLIEELLSQPLERDKHLLCWIEIEQIRMISNSLGFAASDHALVNIAELIRDAFNDPAMQPAYLGSDQFAVLISGHDANHVYGIANQFCATLTEHRIEWQGQKIPLCVGVGIVDVADAQGSLPQTLKLATGAACDARRSGCNRAMVSGRAQVGDQTSERSLETLMYVERILEHGELRLRAQKIAHVTNSDMAAHHYEVLLGVVDEQGESVDIGILIPAAEAHDRMHLVDRWVIQGAITWAGDNPASLERLGGLAINLSGQSVHDRSLIAYVRKLLDEHSVSPSRISFEVTETATISRIDEARLVLQGLRNIGCSCALDDFGTGLSSYEYLKELPVDYLKIDGSFVKTIATNQNDYAVVRSINEIGHFMGTKTIAEYVVDDAVRRCLEEIGVDFAQGFGIEKPRLLEELV